MIGGYVNLIADQLVDFTEQYFKSGRCSVNLGYIGDIKSKNWP